MKLSVPMGTSCLQTWDFSEKIIYDLQLRGLNIFELSKAGLDHSNLQKAATRLSSQPSRSQSTRYQ